MFEKTEGTVQNIAGKFQEAVGSATGDEGTRLEGKTRQLGGKVQEGYGEALNQLRDAPSNNPLATLAAVAGLSFIVGALWSRR